MNDFMHIVLFSEEYTLFASITDVLFNASFPAHIQHAKNISELNVDITAPNCNLILYDYTLGKEPLNNIQTHLPVVILYTDNHQEAVLSIKNPIISDVLSLSQINRLPFILKRESKIARLQSTLNNNLFVLSEKTAADSLKQAENRFRKIIEGFSTPILICDQYRIIRYANTAFISNTGYQIHDMIGQSINIILPSEEMDEIEGKLAAILKHQGATETFRHQILCSNGRSEISLTTINNLSDHDGQAMLILHLQIITQQISSERKLLQSESILQTVFEHSPYGIIAANKTSGKLSWINPAMSDLFLYSTEEFYNLTINDLHPIESELIINDLLIQPEDKLFKSLNNIACHRKDNSIFYCDMALGSICIDNETHLIAFYSDTTREFMSRREVEMQLRRLGALRAIDMAIASVHDIRITLKTVVDEVIAQLKVDAASILLYQPGSNMLQFAAGQGFYSNYIIKGNLKLGEGIAGQIALNRETIHIPNLNDVKDQFSRFGLLKGESFITYIGVPLIAKGQIKGVLEIFHRSLLTPDDSWLSFFEMLGGQASIAIDNAQSFGDLQRSNTNLLMAYEATIEGWSRAMDLRDKETEGHTQRVTELSLKLARIIGITEEQILYMRRGALLHDIGKLGIPDNILLKEGKLTDEEWVIMRKHPVFAFEMLSPISYLNTALDIPYCHHEKWDGSGYPRGLSGKQIPLPARIFAIIDVYDALTSDRPYRSKWTKEKTLEYIQAGSGTHFDPDLVNIFIEAVRNGDIDL